ncbi:MAG: deoxyribonuclease V [Nitrospirota bacterium]
MRSRALHDWNVTPAEAIALQRALARQVALAPLAGPVRYIAGADMALDNERGLGLAGVIVYRVEPGEGSATLREVERVWAEGPLTFPYVPGLLSFREAPILLRAFEQLRTEPELILCDGQGIAHPRGLGIASHLGLILDRPTIGCAKSRLVGGYTMPDGATGSHSPLSLDGRVIGAVVRTRANVRPLFVSPGHRITLEEAITWTLACCDGYRIPKPTREADQYVAALKRSRACATPAPATAAPALRAPATGDRP